MMITVDEALKIVLGVTPILDSVTVPLHQAHGRILAQDIQAPDPLPPYPASIKVFSFSPPFSISILF